MATTPGSGWGYPPAEDGCQPGRRRYPVHGTFGHDRLHRTEGTIMNVAARMGSWSARHRTKAIGGWLLFVVAAVAIGSALGTKQLSNAQGSNGDAAKAETILASAGFNTPASEN